MIHTGIYAYFVLESIHKNVWYLSGLNSIYWLGLDIEMAFCPKPIQCTICMQELFLFILNGTLFRSTKCNVFLFNKITWIRNVCIRSWRLFDFASAINLGSIKEWNAVWSKEVYKFKVRNISRHLTLLMPSWSMHSSYILWRHLLWIKLLSW